ncbi:MAG: 6-phospho-beta-glucosidase [Oscillospiraceae bacterium]|nr:6-phospho-beta-glucosidase [Oscillospiraceae bacterium]MCL2278770.1 6-phospho-beta-glucosidase [Oscillospiraceae bacterium]
MAKIAVIGAGSTYTPELIEGLVERAQALQIESVSLMDIDRPALDLLGGLAKRQLEKGGFKGEVELTEDLHRALDGAKVIFAQIRPGKMEGRIRDEKIPLKYGLLGQETTGAGGFMQALRTVPVIMDLVADMKRLSESDAWLINFSNPSGIIAEAVLNKTDANMVGLCNCAINMVKGIADAIGTREFDYEYVGLNHLSWITSVVKHGETENIVSNLAGKADTSMKNNPVAHIDPALFGAVPYIPSSYLNYYYSRSEQVKLCLEAEKCRGEICVEIEAKLREQYADPNLNIKPPELAQRGGSMYATAAVSAAESIILDKDEIHVVAAKNNGAVPFMDDSDAVEVLSRLGKDGITPLPVKVYNDYVVGLMRAVKAYEKLTVRAALEGDRDIALAALMAHPLVGDIAKALPLLNEMLEANKEYLPRFYG